MFGKVHFNDKKLVVYTGSFNLVIQAHYLMLSRAINQIGLKSQFLLYTKERQQLAKKVNLKHSMTYLESDKMKYFVFSDLHSCVSKLEETLDKYGYDSNNPNHKLLFLGDAFDKGKEHFKTYQFFKNAILNSNKIGDTVVPVCPSAGQTHNGTGTELC